MNIRKKLLKIYPIIIALFVFLCASSAGAASLYLEPSSGNIIKGCQTQIRVRMSTEGQSSNGAQAYVNYSSLGTGGTISITGGGIFSTYGTPPGIPAGTRGIFGYGGIVSGSALNFAVINVKSNINGPLSLTLRFEDGDITSKIAAHPTSENILTSVGSGAYTVIDGYCETRPPYLTNLNPVPDKPNHPVGQNIKFDIKDDESGLDMSTFTLSVKQNGVEVPKNITQTACATEDKCYSIDIDPVNNLIPELKVVVSVSARDKANNLMTRTYQFNDLSCAELGCPVGGVVPQCSDGIDNDQDGRIDFPEDPGCESTEDNNEFDPSEFFCPTTTSIVEYEEPTTTPIIEQPEISDQAFSTQNMRFFLANRAVEVYLDATRSVDTLVGVSFTVSADISGVAKSVEKVNLLVNDSSYQLFYDNLLQMYAVDLNDLQIAGLRNAALVIEYAEDEQQVVPFTISVLPKGEIIGSDKDGQLVAVPQASIILERLVDNQYTVFRNIKSDSLGQYGFIVPNGAYRLIVESDGYRTEQTNGFSVTNSIINRNFKLITAVSLLDPDVSIGEKATYISDVAQDQFSKLVASANDPKVERAAQTTLAPIALGVASATIIPAILLSLLPYLRFLFLQPILLLGYRRRKKWGVVYNSLTKMPIDLAMVRLINAGTGKIVQSRVTDSEGRFAFFVEPGLYRIEANKQGFVFPTKVLQDYREDTSYLDLYHGEPVHVDEKDAAISANIPMDPIGAEAKTPRRIKINKFFKETQRFIASLSIAAGLLAVIISPTWWTIALLVAQVLLYLLFKRLAMPKKPKNWGIVYDRQDKKPINRAVARLFSKQFNKLISTEVTDNKGRYSFMVGPNEYYITFEKIGYDKNISSPITIKSKNEVVKINAALSKATAQINGTDKSAETIQ
jgi:hypothetical protein